VQIRAVPLWDLPIRIFHWALVFLLVIAWLSAELEWRQLHYLIGLVVIGLIGFRILWGLWGSAPARFSSFLKGPRAVLSYLCGLGRRRPSYTYGHNPVGGWMVAAILATVLLQAMTGLFNSDDVLFDGPFHDKVPEAIAKLMGALHEGLFNVLLLLIAAHVAAIAFYAVWKHENLVRAMLTGKARLPARVSETIPIPGGAAAKVLYVLRLALSAAIATALPLAIYLLN